MTDQELQAEVEASRVFLRMLIRQRCRQLAADLGVEYEPGEPTLHPRARRGYETAAV